MPSRSNKFGSGMHGISCADPPKGWLQKNSAGCKATAFYCPCPFAQIAFGSGMHGISCADPQGGSFKRIQPVARQPLFIAHALSLKLHLAQGCLGLAALIPEGVASKEFSRLQSNRFLLPMPFRSNCIWLRDRQ